MDILPFFVVWVSASGAEALRSQSTTAVQTLANEWAKKGSLVA
jgi:hypothetical protein